MRNLTTALVIVAGIAASACADHYVSQRCSDPGDSCSTGGVNDTTYSNTPAPAASVSSTIDSGVLIKDRFDAGTGAGVFVEYQGSGKWHVFLGCDVLKSASSPPCTWDVVLTPAGTQPFNYVQAEPLGANDTLEPYYSDSVRIRAVVTTAFKGLTLYSQPGVALRVDAQLDEKSRPDLVNWSGDNGLHSGAPSTPIDLIPSSP